MVNEYMRVEDFFENAVPCTIAEDVREQREKDYDPIAESVRITQRVERIGQLMHKVFGAEGN
jgi:hypothetical protein